MTPFTTTLSCLLALVAGQTPHTRDRDEGGAHRLVIENGARRSVHYFPNSQGDADSYRELERAENEAYIAADLQRLKGQYIRDEQYLQPIRRQVQERLYGGNYTVSTSQSSMGSTFYPSFGTSSGAPLSSPTVSSSGFPLGGQILPNSTATVPRSGSPGLGTGTFTPSGATSSLPFNVNSVTPFGSGLPGAFGGGAIPTAPGMGSGTTTTVGGTSLAGPTTSAVPTSTVVNNRGGFFNPLGFGGLGLGASALLGSPYFSMFGNTATSQSSQTNTNNYSLANGMGDEGRLKTAMSAVLASQSTVEYQQRVRANLDAARAAVQNRQPHVAVTLKDGEKRSGRLVQQNGEWLVIREGDEEHFIRTTDIARMTKHVGSTDRTARLEH
jgi:hypothetical protein